MTIEITRRSVINSILAGTASLTVSPSVFSLVGPSPNIIRLSSNENPYGPSKKALHAAAKASSKGAYYPSKITMELVQLIAEKNNLDTSQVTLSSGSNEALSAAVVGWGKNGSILCPAFTYDLHLG